MTLYEVLKYLHIVLAMTAVGANLTYGIWLSRAAAQPGHWEFALRGVKFLDDRMPIPPMGFSSSQGWP